ncbi:MAG: carboxypeptidase-like regulatory domain-containing protein [Bacteroidota bacterium]|nr:carboxypeptidase-like regulatory domain-containing protein [Bacteroidota bacterium]
MFKSFKLLHIVILDVKTRVLLRTLYTFLLIFFIQQHTCGQQITISGTVYDITKKTPIESVSVLSNLGKGTATDSLGRYSITVSERDSIYFSFLNKPTPKYAVSTIANPGAFDISIMKKVQQLPSVFVKQRNYHMDSLQNRSEYEKIFNYKKPGFSTSMNSNAGGMAGIGVDLDELINMFKFKKNKRMLSFQNRLVAEEREKYVNHRFNKGLVRKLTGLQEPQIDVFMSEYRPTLEMTLQFNDLEFGQFIVEAFKYYKAGIKINRSVFNRELP